MKHPSFWNKYCHWFTTTHSSLKQDQKVGSTRDKTRSMTSQSNEHVSLPPAPGCMQDSPIQAEKKKPSGWDERIETDFFKSMVLVSRLGKMLHRIWDGQDVSSQEGRWEPGSQHEDGSLWRREGLE